MINRDFLQRFIFDGLPIRGEIVHLQASYQTIINQHSYPKPVQILLGEALAVVALLSATIKMKGRLSFQFQGKGKLKLLLVQCDHEFNLRGTVKWQGISDEEDLWQSLQEGILSIRIEADAKNHYQGVVTWQGDSLAESIEGYFKQSEQIDTKIWLSVDEQSAFGLLLQKIPQQVLGEEKAMLEACDRIVSQTNPEKYLSTEDLLKRLYPADDVRIFPSVAVKFKCNCDRARGANAISLLGEAEATEELEAKQVIVVTCDFCNKEYIFDSKDVEIIFQQNTPPTLLN